MLEMLKQTLWQQFGASIQMLKNAIALCPEEYWNNNKKLFYTAYHCMLFLDYYLTIPPTNFTTPLPFTITATENIPAEAIDDLVPDRIYSQQEMLNYLQAINKKCRALIASLTEEKLAEKWIEEPNEIVGGGTIHYSVLEILFFNMRHVQHHTAQLNLLLRQGINNAPDWV